jgi:hypothetical protein
MSVHVTHVETETEDHGLKAEVTLHRVPDNMIYVGDRPNPNDLPDDIVAALRLWLERAS